MKNHLIVLSTVLGMLVHAASAHACTDNSIPCVIPNGPIGSPAFMLEYEENFNDPAINTNDTKLDRDNFLTHQDNIVGVPDTYDPFYGRRWSSFYDDNIDETAFTRSVGGEQVLIQRGVVDRVDNDPDRNAEYVDPDDPSSPVNFFPYKLYTSYFRSLAFISERDRTLENPMYRWEPGHFFEIRVNFSKMNMGGHRHSFWLMPGVVENNQFKPVPVYDNNAANGVEIDIYEYEAKPVEHNNTLLMKVIGDSIENGGTGSTENSISSVPSGIELQGDNNNMVKIQPGFDGGLLTDDRWHKIGLYWNTDKIIWFVDGHAVVEDKELVPQVPMYLLISREMNSGVHDGGEGFDPAKHVLTDLLRKPVDHGLFGDNVGLDRNLAKLGEIASSGNSLGLADKDHVMIDYIKVWKVESNPPTTPLPRPSPAANAQVIRFSNTSAQLFWNPPNNGPGTGVLRYEVERNGSLELSNLTNTWFMNDLESDAELEFEIFAVNAAGTRSNATCASVGLHTTNPSFGDKRGDCSGGVLATATAPSAPFSFRSDSFSANEINLYWEHAMDSNGTIARYELFDKNSGNSLYQGNALSTTVGGLMPGTEHDFFLIAIDNDGEKSPKVFLTQATQVAAP